MKALTICQPYAELIARGDKRVENRKWATDYRGLLAIHAGKSRDWLSTLGDESNIALADMAFGAVVAVASLVDCVRVDLISSSSCPPHLLWMRDHEHTHGPWCFVLEAVIRLATPYPCRGARTV